MKTKLLYLLLVLGSLLTNGCTQSCDDRETSVTLRNDTGDTICSFFCTGGYGPGPYGQFDTVPPNRSVSKVFYKSTIESDGVGVWLLSMDTYKSYTRDAIVNNKLYDAVLSYSWEELSAKQFRVIVRNLCKD